MKYYFIVDNHDTVFKFARFFTKWKMIGLHHPAPGFFDNEKNKSPIPVFMYAIFKDEGVFNKWCSTPGVEHIGCPIEGEPVTDDHMQKLKRFHKHEQVDHPSVPDAKVWKDPATGHTLSQNLHARQIAKHTAKQAPDFVFRIFSP